MSPRDLVDIMGGGRAPQSGFGDGESVKSDLCDFDLALHYDTGRAVLVSATGEEGKAVWLPKAHVGIVRRDRTVAGTCRNGQTAAFPLVTVTCPQWLAQAKGLI